MLKRKQAAEIEKIKSLHEKELAAALSKKL